MNNIKIKDGRILVVQKINSSPKTQKPKISTHHIFIIDCSGSMYSELYDIRKDLYNKISTHLDKDDSLSVLWFSGKGDYGFLVEDFRIDSDKSLTNIKKLIDQKLTSRGLTAFREPFVEARELIERLNKSTRQVAHSLFFLTDGCDNSWSEKQILASVGDLKELLSSATIVEYGYYCNKDLISKMAAEVGGSHIFAKAFQDYEPFLQKQFMQKIESPREYLKLSEKAMDGFAFSFDASGQVISYNTNDKEEVFIDKNATEAVYYMAASVSGKVDGVDEIKNLALGNKQELIPLYAAMYSYSRRSDFKTISDILRVLGDAYFIKKKSNTFGTQKINELEAEFAAVITDSSLSMRDGYDLTLEPREDAYCVMSMVEDLMNDEESLWYPSKLQNYKRISRKTERADTIPGEDLRNKTQELLVEGKVDEVIELLGEFKNSSQEIEFINEEKENGFPINNLTWNSSRANLSVMVTYNGYVNIPTNTFGIPEGRFDTHIFRNYNIISDGIINNYVLPVSLSKETFDKLQTGGLLKGEIYESGKIYQLDYSSLPVINQQMVKESSAETLFRAHYELLKVKASDSVFTYFKKQYLGGLSKGLIDKYGADGTAWLKTIGITDNGFAPKVAQAPTTEEAFVNAIEVKIDKIASAASAKDVVQKMKDGKPLTPREAIVKPYIDEFYQFQNLLNGLEDKKQKEMIETWITDKSKAIRKEKGRLSTQISKSIFMTIIGKEWFTDLESRDKKELELLVDNENRKFTISDETVKILI